MSGGLGAVITEELSSPFLKVGKAADTLRMKVLSLFLRVAVEAYACHFATTMY